MSAELSALTARSPQRRSAPLMRRKGPLSNAGATSLTLGSPSRRSAVKLERRMPFFVLGSVGSSPLYSHSGLRAVRRPLRLHCTLHLTVGARAAGWPSPMRLVALHATLLRHRCTQPLGRGAACGTFVSYDAWTSDASLHLLPLPPWTRTRRTQSGLILTRKLPRRRRMDEFCFVSG